MTLISQASVAELERRSQATVVDASRFRMLIEFTNARPHVEDKWKGIRAAVGTAVLQIGGPSRATHPGARQPPGPSRKDPTFGSPGSAEASGQVTLAAGGARETYRRTPAAISRASRCSLGRGLDELEILVVMGAAVVGAVVGALFTAGGTWWVSVRLDRQREYRNIASAVGILAGELDDNRRRIDDPSNPAPLKDLLTIGDWSAVKGSFAGLAVRNRPLWKDVAHTYGVIYEVRNGWPTDAPEGAELADLVRRLRDEHDELGREIGAFSSLRGGSKKPPAPPPPRPSSSSLDDRDNH